MLEKLLDYAKSVDKYTVRIADEIVHREINRLSDYIESKTEMSKDGQANYLTLISASAFSCYQSFEMINSAHKLGIDNLNKISTVFTSGIGIYFGFFY